MSYFFVSTRDDRRTFVLEAADSKAASGIAPTLMTAEEDFGVHIVELVPVKDEEAAHAHFAELVEEEDYRDNYRSAYQAAPADMEAYEASRRNGCCGSADVGYLVGGFNVYWLGCNFGH